jgi:hypothetical protein
MVIKRSRRSIYNLEKKKVMIGQRATSRQGQNFSPKDQVARTAADLNGRGSIMIRNQAHTAVRERRNGKWGLP